MIISEYQLRSIIKNMLLENFLDSKVDSLEAVEISGLKYQAYGYITQKGKKCAMIMVKKKNHQKMMDIGAILLKAGAKYTIENNGKKFGQVAHKNNKNAYYAVPVDTKGIKFSSVKLETGASSMADWAVEIGGILGGIPLIGEPIDIAAGIVAAIKRPPDYLLAACSILFALPAIGTAIAIAGKPLIKKFGKEGAETVGKEIGKAMAKSGKEIGSETIELAAKKGDELFDALLSDDTINQACSLLNESRLLEASCSISASPWREAIENVRKEFDELIEGVRKAEKESLDNLKKSGDDASKAADDKIKKLKKDADLKSKEIGDNLTKETARLVDEKSAMMAKAFKDESLEKQYSKLSKVYEESTGVIKKMEGAKTIKSGSKNYARLTKEMGEITQPYFKIMDEIKGAQKEISERLAKATEANDIIAMQREKDLLGVFLGHSADNIAAQLKAQNAWIKKSIDETGEVCDVHELILKGCNETALAQEQIKLMHSQASADFIEAGFDKLIQKDIRLANYDLEAVGERLDWDIQGVKRNLEYAKEDMLRFSGDVKKEAQDTISELQKMKKKAIDNFIKDEEIYERQLKKNKDTVESYKKNYQEMVDKYGEEVMKKPSSNGKTMLTPAQFEKTIMNTSKETLDAMDPASRANQLIKSAKLDKKHVERYFSHAEERMSMKNPT